MSAVNQSEMDNTILCEALTHSNRLLQKEKGKLQEQVESLHAANSKLVSQQKLVLRAYIKHQAESASLRDRVQVLETRLQRAEKRLAALLGRESDYPAYAREPSIPSPACYTMNSFEVRDEWVIPSGKTVKAKEGEVFVNFGMGILWRMQKGDVEKMKGWITGDSLKISYRNAWHPDTFTKFHYCISNPETKQEFIAGAVAVWEDQLPKITAVDQNRLTVTLSDGNVYCAITDYLERNRSNTHMVYILTHPHGLHIINNL